MNSLKFKLEKELIFEADKCDFGTGYNKRNQMLVYMVTKIVNDFLSKNNDREIPEIKILNHQVISKLLFEDRQVIPIIIETEMFDPKINIIDFGIATKGLKCHKSKDIFLFVVVDIKLLDIYLMGCLTSDEIYDKGNFKINSGVAYLKSDSVNDLKNYFV